MAVGGEPAAIVNRHNNGQPLRYSSRTHFFCSQQLMYKVCGGTIALTISQKSFRTESHGVSMKLGSNFDMSYVTRYIVRLSWQSTRLKKGDQEMAEYTYRHMTQKKELEMRFNLRFCLSGTQYPAGLCGLDHSKKKTHF